MTTKNFTSPLVMSIINVSQCMPYQCFSLTCIAAVSGIWIIKTALRYTHCICALYMCISKWFKALGWFCYPSSRDPEAPDAISTVCEKTVIEENCDVSHVAAQLIRATAKSVLGIAQPRSYCVCLIRTFSLLTESLDAVENIGTQTENILFRLCGYYGTPWTFLISLSLAYLDRNFFAYPSKTYSRIVWFYCKLSPAEFSM